MKTADQILEQKGLPINLDAERFILGAALTNNDLLTDMVSSLTAQDFAIDKHRLMFARILDMHTRGVWVDRVTLCEDLQRRDELNTVDGISYIASLQDDMPRLPDIGSYITIVKEKAILRQTIEACERLKHECLTRPDSASDLVARGERVMSEIQGRMAEDTEFQTPEEIIASAGGPDGYFRSRRVPGLLTQFEKFNAATRGLQPGSLIILAARTSKGKSAFASNLAVQLASQVGVALFSLEMDKQEQTDRILALSGACGFNDLRGNDRVVIQKAIRNASALPIYICDTASRSVPAIHARVRRLKARVGVGLVIVDYLQLLSPAGKFENRTQEVSAMTRALKLAAQDLRTPFLVLSQLTRPEKAQSNPPPRLQDLRESGSIEQDANMVLFLHSEGEYKDYAPGEPAPVTLMIAKQRSGPTEDIAMQFYPDRGLFTEAA